MNIEIQNFEIKEAETSPPTRYNSGSIILAMENAGKLIEDEALREQIKGAGIGTSATRAEILKKLEKIGYIASNAKTQVITPSVKGELIYEVVKDSMPDVLNPELTASWEKGLNLVANGEIKADEFMQKLESYIKTKIERAVAKKPYINPPKLFMKVKVE
jgi:DNA topoisomerase-3